jgi:hypothetical protein
MRTNTIMLAAAAIAAASLWMEDAMAAPTTWVYTNENDRPVISNFDKIIRLWTPTPQILDAPGPNSTPYDSICISFRQGDYVNGLVLGNSWTGVYPPPAPSLYQPGGFHLEGTTLEKHGADYWQYWNQATFSPGTMHTEGAYLTQDGDVGDFDITDYAYDMNDFAYIGYSDYLIQRFGYLQIERASATDVTQWRLVGYAYGDSGESLQVVDLTIVPPAPSAALLAAGMAATSRTRVGRHHRACRATLV